MATLIKNVQIPGLTKSKTDVILDKGILRKYKADYKISNTIEGVDLYLIPSFTDLGTYNGEPGHEERETTSSLTLAAANGGYGSLIILPHTLPVADEGTQIESLLRKSGTNGVELLPLGAVSVENKGVDPAEILDMADAGALAFTDGYKAVQSAGLMIRALDYVKRFNNIVINRAADESLVAGGLMHEGKVSTRLGLKANPSISEHIMLMRDIELLRYTGSRLHVWNISTAGAVELIKAAKAEGLDISCSVSYLHLIKNEEVLSGFNAIYKVDPPLRGESDRQALIQGVIDGTIDCITSLHRPWNEEVKDLEFVHARVGAAGLETAFAALWTHASELRDWELLNNCLNVNVRKIFGLKPNEIKWDEEIRGTLVDAGQSFIFDESHIKSKGKNYPFMGEEFPLTIKKI